ncbi:MAG: AraC family transcriptional regulator [Cohaesibacter sp.]|nr:AraC family transcriptional regulator [Cohaesibacter sp.]
MTSDMIHCETISDLHDLLEYDKPEHPLITLIDVQKLDALRRYEMRKIRQGYYSIILKIGADCDLKYGRKSYDFKEGSMVFMAPGQISTIEFGPDDRPFEGWALCFHPDILRRSPLANHMQDYSYFSYSLSEALHISQKEKELITSLAEIIQTEYSANPDSYSQKLITSNLEVLLNYCERFYGRQFITRTFVEKDVISQFETLLKTRILDANLELDGIPSVQELAEKMGYSSHYLSDLLKKETGRTTLEHIHEQMLEKAQNCLIGSDAPISRIAYDLGYKYPEHFSSFFKKKTGISPAHFRKGKEGKSLN